MVSYFDTLLEQELASTRILQPVSLLLLDINMPVMDGLQALRLIKKKYEQVNDQRAQNNGQKQIDTCANITPILRPFVCYLS